jgi:hypothetical protein
VVVKRAPSPEEMCEEIEDAYDLHLEDMELEEKAPNSEEEEALDFPEDKPLMFQFPKDELKTEGQGGQVGKILRYKSGKKVLVIGKCRYELLDGLDERSKKLVVVEKDGRLETREDVGKMYVLDREID